MTVEIIEFTCKGYRDDRKPEHSPNCYGTVQLSRRVAERKERYARQAEAAFEERQRQRGVEPIRWQRVHYWPQRGEFRCKACADVAYGLAKNAAVIREHLPEFSGTGTEAIAEARSGENFAITSPALLAAARTGRGQKGRDRRDRNRAERLQQGLAAMTTDERERRVFNVFASDWGLQPLRRSAEQAGWRGPARWPAVASTAWALLVRDLVQWMLENGVTVDPQFLPKRAVLLCAGCTGGLFVRDDHEGRRTLAHEARRYSTTSTVWWHPRCHDAAGRPAPTPTERGRPHEDRRLWLTALVLISPPFGLSKRAAARLLGVSDPALREGLDGRTGSKPRAGLIEALRIGLGHFEHEALGLLLASLGDL